MGKYWESIKLLILAIFALVLGFVWTDAFLIAFTAFIALVIVAGQSAFSVSQTFAAKVKLLSVFSVILALLIVLGFTVMNPPQCPDNYTQEQINSAHGHCIIGANIGIGLYFMFVVIPFALVVLALWGSVLSSRIKSRTKT